MASLFGISGDDLQKKIQPRNGEFTFSIGDGEDDSMTAEEALAVIETQEDRVLSLLPSRHRDLMRRVEGEILTKCAREGQTTLRVSLRPLVAETLALYVDFPETRSYQERRHTDALDADGFSAALDTGIVLLTTPLREGQRVFADYEHAAASSFRWLRECVIALAAAEISRMYAYFRTADGFERFEAWERSALDHLKSMQKMQRPGVAELERIALATELRPASWREMFD